MQRAKRVLFVDDEESMRKIVRYALEDAGYDVATAEDAAQGRRVLEEWRPDLAILDVMLPDGSGLDLCREVRAGRDIPVIMLSARSEEIDKVLGLELGADDYVTKPFSPRELVSRVKAQLRRDERLGGGNSSIIAIGGLKIDPGSRQVSVDGREVRLTASEFDILHTLARSPGKVFPRIAILNELWHGGFVGDERAVDVHVHNIREKIETDPSAPEYLLTVRGVGYRLRER